MLQHNTDDNASLHICDNQSPADAYLIASLMMQLTLKLFSVRLTEESFEMVKPNIQLG